MSATLFVSHASADDNFVWQMQQALEDLGQPVWIDSRELRGGNPLWSVIQEAVQAAGAFAVIVSPASLQSKWVGKELKYALELQTQRGHQAFPVIPLSLDDTKLGVLEVFFGGEPNNLSICIFVEAALAEPFATKTAPTINPFCSGYLVTVP